MKEVCMETGINIPLCWEVSVTGTAMVALRAREFSEMSKREVSGQE